jgi:Thiolase, N-terminal domain
MDAVGMAARAIKAGDSDLIIAGGLESMSRAPFVMPKANSAFSRNAEIYDTTIGWRFINTRLKEKYGVDSMPETGTAGLQRLARGPGPVRVAQSTTHRGCLSPYFAPAEHEPSRASFSRICGRCLGGAAA